VFYNNALYRFKLPEGAPATVAGSILNASAMSAAQFMRRNFRTYPYLQHRALDPQLYLAGLDRNVARSTVANLATWPWFVRDVVPEFDSGEHGSLKRWEELVNDDLIAAWPGTAPTEPGDIYEAVRSCVQRQIELGCEVVILPSPLTTVAATTYELETAYLDAGVRVATELQVHIPVLATIALSDNLLRGASAFEHPLLHTVSSQLAARRQINGAYIVIEQANEPGYACVSRDTVMALLLLVDDLSRGAAKSVYVNFSGNFGAVLTAAGASVWGSGYYLSQRRLQLAHFSDAGGGPAYPRFYSLRLAGDVGVENDIPLIYRSGLASRVITRSDASAGILRAFEAGSYPASVPDWVYRPNNVPTATQHYYEVTNRIGAFLASLGPEHRIEMVQRWLDRAVQLTEDLDRIGVSHTHSDLVHQRVWLEAFNAWRRHAGV
jgi:hypothetical protein